MSLCRKRVRCPEKDCFPSRLRIRFSERLAEAGVEPSVGSVGDSYDNALLETVMALYKTDEIRPKGPWRSVEEVEIATLDRVHWFDHRRILEPIGDMSPAEYEARYQKLQEVPAIRAAPN